jgi:DNA-binding NarL/FixJ family response regulator
MYHELRKRGTSRVSIDPLPASDGHERIAVALVIDDEGLRRRALQALNGSEERFVLAAHLETADVMIADHVLGADELDLESGSFQSGSVESALPAIVIGDRATIDAAMRRGYAGGLLPSFTITKLRVAIEAAAHGLICTDARTEPAPIFDDEGDVELGLRELTMREVEVLQQLMTGASNKEIARRLQISVHTAKFHVASIAGKLGATGRTDAVARALRLARAMI